jgi:NADH-quinone oxidoreductase subunit G
MLHAALSQGFDLPYFCWHPALGSVGACRQCAVKQFKDEKDSRGKIVMACLTPAIDGTRISIKDPEALEFRAASTEWLMVNHPHDCPVCDEGGECHLQDMTVMTGHVTRRYRFDKRTHNNQYLGPFVNHEMNRCIQCYRCVRFYRDFAGGRDFDVFAAHDNVYFGRHTDGVLESEFSGNLVEICPTGVFTDKSLKQHFTRKWDLQTAPSICVHCGLGCNTIPGERYGILRRIRNRYNSDVNGYFLCDRGRYGYEFVNSPKRIKKTTIRIRDEVAPQSANKNEGLQRLEEILQSSPTLIGIGSPRASLEANFALRCLVGEKHFFAGISAKEARFVDNILRNLKDGPASTASLHEAEMADAVLVLGEDLTNTAPMLALALRQSVRNQPEELVQRKKIDLWNDYAVREITQDQKGPLYIASPAATRLDDVATHVIHLSPDDIARLGFAVAHLIDPTAPGISEFPGQSESIAKEITQKLKEAKRPLIVSGTSLGNAAMIQAAANLAWALRAAGKEAKLVYAVPECNSLGLAMLDHGDLERALQEVISSKNVTLIILENDLYRRADAQLVNKLLHSASHVIALDYLENATTAVADMVLPAATFAESEGTLVNNESRAQRFYQVMETTEDVQASWRWITELMELVKHDLSGKWLTIGDVIQALSTQDPSFNALIRLVPPASFRIVGQKIPRQPHRYSGRTSMHADIDINEPKPPDDPDSPLSFSMEGFKGQPPSALITHYWTPGWNSVQSLNKFQSEVGGPLRGGDPGQRLIEAVEGKVPAYFRDIPAAFSPRQNEYLVVPFQHIYGSEELSRYAPAVAELSPDIYVAMGLELAGKLGVVQGQLVNLVLEETSLRLPVQLSSSLQSGMIGLPLGYPEIPPSLPAWGKFGSDDHKQEA